MERTEIIQIALNAVGRGNYLEIGVSTGSSFIPLRAARKWGVDPDPYLSWKRILKYRLFSLLKIKDEGIFKETSDAFFRHHAGMLQKAGIDVAFVDGLHTSEQALDDVLNCLDYLKPGGVILMHDCNPQSETAAFRAASIEEVAAKSFPGWDGTWNGDVWRAVVHLRALHDDLNVFVLNCDNGVGVVRRGRPAEKLPYSKWEIQKMDYGFLAQNRQALLGLRPPEYIHDFLLRPAP